MDVCDVKNILTLNPKSFGSTWCFINDTPLTYYNKKDDIRWFAGKNSKEYILFFNSRIEGITMCYYNPKNAQIL